MDKLKKAFRSLFSMRFALILLGLMTAVCFLGSIIPQGEIDSYYTVNYSEKPAMLILLLELDDVFHAVWFIVLTGFLCLNLLGCNILRFPLLIKQTKEGFTPEKAVRSFTGEGDSSYTGDIKKLFSAMGFKKLSEGKDYVYSVRHKAGLWGAWLTHLGMLTIIVGFALGQMFSVSYTVYGVPGETLPIGDTGMTLTIDSFSANLREDETVEQYISHITVTDKNGSSGGETSVNHPLVLNGYKYYQNSTGWAAELLIFNGDELIQDEILCAGEYLSFADNERLVIGFNAFYPDYVKGADGMPATKSSAISNPGYLYSVYYNGQRIGMNVLVDDYITIDDYTIDFVNPQQYSLIQIKHDPFTWLALIGGILICFALLLAFYYRLEELYAVRLPDGAWKVYAKSRKGGVLFKEKLADTVTELCPVNNTDKH